MFRTLAILTLILGADTVLPGQAAKDPPSETREVDARIKELEDREEISRLLIDYGRLLDQRDFAAFARLFAEKGEYVGGGGTEAVRGPEAIGAMLEDIFRRNPSGLNSPNAHLFTNTAIEIDGDMATSVSMGIFAARDNEDSPAAIMLATYKDTFVREDGRWKFLRRAVLGNIPSSVREASK